MKKAIVLILTFMLLLTSCTVVDTTVMTDTKSPNLNASPINGIWETSEIIKNESRTPYKIGDKFYFNVDFIATENEVYLSPEFEILTIDWSNFQSERLSGQVFSEISGLDKVNLIHINSNNQALCELISLNSQEILIYIHNQFLKLKRVQPTISTEEKNEIIREYSAKNHIAKKDDSWGVLLGYKEYRYDETNNLPNNTYKTLLIEYINNEISFKILDNLILNNNGRLDKYEIRRIAGETSSIDEFYLNNRKLNIKDHDNGVQSRIFGLNYISNNYVTLEYYYPEINKLPTLSTYNINFVDGISQLKSDDIIAFSSDRIVENITKSNSETAIHDAIYNIGIFRENGLYVLKSRIVSNSNFTRFNRDITLSSNFTNANNRTNTLISYLSIKNAMPQLSDIYVSPEGNFAIVVKQDEINVYEIKGKEIGNLVSNVVLLPRNSTLVSSTWVTERELDILREENLLSFIK